MNNRTPEDSLRSNIAATSTGKWWAYTGVEWSGPFPSRLDAELFLCELWEF